MSTICDYLAKQKAFQEHYGERTVLFYQIGTFYETFQHVPSDCTTPDSLTDTTGKIWSEEIGHSLEISVLLNYVATCENNNEPYSIRNPHKVGIPVIAYEKCKNTLLTHNYVVIRMDQKKVPLGSKEKTERFVAEICNPVMELSHIQASRPTSNVMCLYLEHLQTTTSFERFIITAGIAVVDVVTGKNGVCEFYSKDNDEIYAAQEIYRFLLAQNPRELVIYLEDVPSSLANQDPTNPYIRYLTRILDLGRFDRVIFKTNEVAAELKTINYQMEFFNRVFVSLPHPRN